MKITQLELKHFKRISLANISYIKLNFNEKIQLILGSNGSGKSSILRELTPLPANPLDYEKDGYKRIKIEHNNKQYTLTSRFNPKQEHSFIVDNTELNTSATPATQRELVEQHFGITNEIRDLLLGYVSLTSLSPAQRRYWFTLMSNTNYDYAISVYNKAKESLRDITGALKLQRARLLSERNTQSDKSITESLKKDIATLKEALDVIYPLRINNNVYSEQELRSRVDLLNTNLQTYTTQISNTTNELSKKSLTTNKASLVNELAHITKRIDELTGRLNSLYEEHNTHKANLVNLEASNKYSVKDIQESIKSSTERLNSIRASYTYIKCDNLAEQLLRTTERVLAVLTPVLYDLPVTNKGDVSKEKLETLSMSISASNNKLSTLTNYIDKLANKIKEQEQIRDHNKTTCPNCNHSWSVGYDQTYYEALLTEYSSLTKELEVITLVNTQEKEHFNKLSQLVNSFRIIRETFDMNELLSWFFKEVINNEYIYKDPRKIISLLESLRVDYLNALPVKAILKEIEELNTKLAIAKVSDEVALENTKSRVSYIEAEVAKINASLYLLRNEKQNLASAITLLDKIDILSSQISTNFNSRDVLFDKGIEVLRKKYFDSLFFEIQKQLTEKEASLSNLVNKERIITDIERNIEELIAEQLVTTDIVEALSPTSGLIAKGLTGFIKQFIMNVNNILSNIWSYKLEILPCEIDEQSGSDLDYKFKVIVSDNVVEDVSKGSSAMKEVIDLAFKLVAMKYLGLESHPVYLDEFAKTLDYEHRKTAHNTIVDLVTNANFSQLFIINHYNDLYSGLVNSEVLVLHSANIVLPPGEVNSHVTIE